MTADLASPFDSIFESREIADQVLDLFRYVLKEAGCAGPDDERFAVTVPRYGRRQILRVNYGNLYFLSAWGDFEDRGPALELPLNLDLLSQDIEYLSTGGRLSQLDSGSHDELDIRMTYVPLPHTDLESQSLRRALASAAHAYERTFGRWKRCMFYQHHRQDVMDAIFEHESRDDLFANGLARRKPERTGKKTNQRYWRITLPDDWRTESPDGEQLRLNVWDECLRHDLAAVGFGEDKENFQVKKFMDIQVGDRVVGFLQHKMIGGVGTVTSGYHEAICEERPADRDFWHGLLWFRIGVDWQPTDLSTEDLAEKTRNMFYGQTVVELSPDDFSAVLDATGLPSDAWDLPAVTSSIRSQSAFSPETFELLSGLHRTPTAEYYQANKSAFQSLLESPFKQLLSDVAERLPAEILDVMETQRRVVAKILKNDFGQGGAWDYYWGAFYPKGSKRSQDAQLSVWMNRDYMEFGFYIGDYGSQQRKRFERNCTAYLDILPEMLNPLIDGESVFFGPRETFSFNSDGTVTQNITYSATLEDFLEDPTQFSCDVSVVIPRDELLQLDRNELAERITRTHTMLFPLVLLAVSMTFERPRIYCTSRTTSSHDRLH